MPSRLGRLSVNLVNELQVSAEQDDVLTVLRKTKRLASKLDRKDIAEWLEAEQNGYGSKQTVPDYRMVAVTLAYRTNGYVPAGYGMLMRGTDHLPDVGLGLKCPIPDSISTILSLIEGKSGGHGLATPIPEGSDICQQLRSTYCFDPMVADQITFLYRYNGAQIRAIPERIKDRVLDWACALERAGVTGEKMTFSVEEKEIAHSITLNIYGSHIEQLSSSGTNHKCS